MTQLCLERCQKIIHRFKRRGITSIRALFDAREHAHASIESKFYVFGRVEAAICPRRLAALKKVFNATHHAVIADVLDRVAVAAQRRDVHLVVHQRGIAQTGPDYLQALVQKGLGGTRMNPRR